MANDAVHMLSIDPVGHHARTQPEKRAVVDVTTDVTLSYGELDVLAARASGWLIGRLGEAGGQRVAFLGRNGIPLLAISLACQRTGNVFVPLNWRLAPAEIDRLLLDCAPALVLCGDEFTADSALDITLAMDEIRGFPPAQPRRPGDSDLAVILYSSGTTGQPKGIMITAGNAFFAALNFALVGEVSSGSVVHSDLPMFHTIGLLAVARTTLMVGGTLVLTDRFAPQRTLEILTNGKLGVTHYFAVPLMAEALERERGFDPAALCHLHAIFLGGSPLSPALVERFLRNDLVLVNGYGMSETGTAIHVPINAEAVRRSAGSVGYPAPYIEVRLVREGRDVASGEIGEIWLRGPSVSPGYWGRASDTAASFADGWYRSGDLAMQDANGAYHIVDRLKDMYVSGGENVYPAEVEAVLLTHEHVADAAVVGIPSRRWGETGLAFVVLKSGTTLDPGELAGYCAGRIAKYKCPARFVAVSAIPRSAAGKILKTALRDSLKEKTP